MALSLTVDYVSLSNETACLFGYTVVPAVILNSSSVWCPIPSDVISNTSVSFRDGDSALSLPYEILVNLTEEPYLYLLEPDRVIVNENAVITIIGTFPFALKIDCSFDGKVTGPALNFNGDRVVCSLSGQPVPGVLQV